MAILHMTLSESIYGTMGTIMTGFPLECVYIQKAMPTFDHSVMIPIAPYAQIRSPTVIYQSTNCHSFHVHIIIALLMSVEIMKLHMSK